MSDKLAALALLKANRDAGSDYFDMFVPIIAYAAKSMPSDEISTDDLRKHLIDSVGIDVPALALSTLIRRCSHRGYLRIDRGSAFRINSALSSLTVEAQFVDAARQCESLVSSFITFARREFSQTISQSDAESHLLNFIKQKHSVLLQRALGVRIAADPEYDSPPKKIKIRYMVAAFITNCLHSDPQLTASITALAKGAILQSVLYFPNLGRIQARMESFDCYLDTRPVIQALGLEGNAVADAMHEFFALLYESGASLKVFEDTLDEIKGVLNFGIDVVNGTTRITTRPSPMAEHLLRTNISDITLTALRDSLPTQLGGLRISVVPRPPLDNDLGIDWSAFESTLTNAIRNYREEPLRHDIDALSAIHRLRKGRSHYHIEDAGSIFVTTNDVLARVSMSLSREETHRDNEIPYAVTTETLATIMWLKRPLAYPDMPAKQLVLSCYSAMNPPATVWSKYLEELAAAKARGSLTDEEYVYLRYSQPARNIFVGHLSDKDQLELTVSVEDLLRKMKSNLTSDLREELQSKSEAVSAVTRNLESVTSERDAISVFVDNRNRSYASTAARAICGIVSPVTFTAVAWYVLASPHLARLEYRGISGSLVVSTLTIFGSSFSIINLYSGVAIRDLLRKSETSLTDIFYKWLHNAFGLTSQSGA